MPRLAFRMKAHAGQEAEYIRRHNPIWPELEATLIEHGVRTYSIYLDRSTNDLFAYLEIDDYERLGKVAATEICRQWWDYMAPLMPVHSDHSPVVGDLEEVFHIEASK
ncbi:MAG: L-rhamnose mutarotase [Pirellulales bacterium]